MHIAPQRGAVPITLDRERVLFFDMAATWLLAQRFGFRFIRALYTVEGEGKDAKVELTNPDALAFFLWVGLRADLADDEVLTREDVEAFIRPWNFEPIFNAIVLAITGATATPPLKDEPGKDAGAAPSPAAAPAASRRASTTTRANDSSAAS